MVEEQLPLGITDELGDFFAQLGVGDADRFDHCHDNVPFRGYLDERPVGGCGDEDSRSRDSGLTGIAVS
jgi:hypothetical protein